MIDYWNTENGMAQLERWQPHCWMKVVAPTEEERIELMHHYGVPESFLTDICDQDERARYDKEDDWSLVILRIPHFKETPSRTPYITIPMGVLYREDMVITVCMRKTAMVDDFIDHQIKRDLGFTDITDMVVRLFLSSAVWYLKDLRQINSIIEKSKRELDSTIDNKGLIALSRLQDSLTYFATSIRGNENLLEKLKFKLPVDDLDQELIEDVRIEMSQARETAGIYTTILDSTMETYSSIINNNMNVVMRVLTAVSIILMFPTLIASFLGMNLPNGLEDKWWGLPLVVLASWLVSLACIIIFRRKRML